MATIAHQTALIDPAMSNSRHATPAAKTVALAMYVNSVAPIMTPSSTNIRPFRGWLRATIGIRVIARAAPPGSVVNHPGRS